VLRAGTVGSGGVVGTNATAACVTPVQAQAMNKYWFGQTPDGSVPDPAANNGFNANLTDGQLWYGLARGANMTALAGANPFTISSDMVALELQNPTLATTSFLNATGNGANGWKTLTYGQLADAFAQGIALQPFFGNINTDNADLSGAKAAAVKIVQYHGSADVLIPTQNSVNYYTRVANLDGGFAKTQAYDRLFLIPGMGHCSGVGTAPGTAGPAVTTSNFAQPAGGQLFGVLKAWVEGGAASAPASVTVTSPDATNSQLLCPYPQKATYNGTGAVNAAASYTCK
jgi:feruloyl esterase